MENVNSFTPYKIIFDASCVVSPFLTIAIPTFKRFDLLLDSLRSVFSQQFCFDVEILIVDNDPDNEQLAVTAMNEFKAKSFKYIKNERNIGMFGNWNQCLHVARGKFITLLHDDDILLPSFSIEMNKFFLSSSEKSSISFNTIVWDQRISFQHYSEATLIENRLGKIKKIIASLIAPYHISLAELFFENRFHGTLGVVLEREKALAIGGFDSGWSPIADYEFWCRWVKTYGYIPRIRVLAGLYRVRNNESLREDIQKGFILQSKKLRHEMVAGKLVPMWINPIIEDLSLLQKIDIDLFWNGEVKSHECESRHNIIKSKLRKQFAKIRLKFQSSFSGNKDV